MMMTLFPLTRAAVLPKALISASQHRFGKEEQLKDPTTSEPAETGPRHEPHVSHGDALDKGSWLADAL
ncbi:unnamed protein product [Gadus morhua 'NCC']